MADWVPGAPRSRIRELDIEGEITLYDGSSQAAVVLNSTASDVWRLLDGQRSIDDIVALLRIAYDTDLDTLRMDVRRTVEELRRHDLLEDATQ